MYRDILTNKWVLGGVGFLIVLSVACVWWYQHDIADEKKQLPKLPNSRVNGRKNGRQSQNP